MNRRTFSGRPWEIILGDVLEILRAFPPDSFDACLGDPPYGLKMMGKRWDYSVPSVNVFAEIERVLKPGAHGLFFGGSRTAHRLAVNVEDGGFELRDTMLWLYSTGYPKSAKVSRAVEKALRETNRAGETNRADVLRVTSWVKMVLRERGITTKQVDTHFGYNGMASHWSSTKSQPGLMSWVEWGEFSRWVDVVPPRDIAAVFKSLRDKIRSIEAVVEKKRFLHGIRSKNRKSANPEVDNAWKGYGTQLKPAYEPVVLARKWFPTTVGRCALEHGTGGLDIDAARIATDWSERPESWKRSGHSAKPKATKIAAPPGTGIECHPLGRWPANVLLDVEAGWELNAVSGDPVGAARYFYTTKADRAERDRGTEGGNDHVAVKPIDLIRYLARMALPPRVSGPRRILVPYAGSGSEIIGCIQAGWDEVVGIEIDPKHITTATQRITRGGVFSSLVKRKTRK